MPALPTSGIVNQLMSVVAHFAPNQAKVLGSRIAAWQGASTYQGGASALLSTVGTRVSSGGLSMQLYPPGIIAKQAYPTNIEHH